jgi:hypothetical protein
MYKLLPPKVIVSRRREERGSTGDLAGQQAS